MQFAPEMKDMPVDLRKGHANSLTYLASEPSRDLQRVHSHKLHLQTSGVRASTVQYGYSARKRGCGFCMAEARLTNKRGHDIH